MEIGYKIKKVRELRNYKQEYMAEKLGISQVSYSRVENGLTKLDLNRLSDIAHVLDVDPIFLLSFDESFILNNCNQCCKTAYNFNILSDQERKVFEDRIRILQAENNKLYKAKT